MPTISMRLAKASKCAGLPIEDLDFFLMAEQKSYNDSNEIPLLAWMPIIIFVFAELNSFFFYMVA